MRKSRKPLVLVSLGLGIVVAASATYVAYPRSPKVLDVGPDLVALVSPGSALGEGASNSARFSGVVAVVGEGCFGIQAGDDEMALAFPYGTKVTSDATALVLPGGTQVAVGDQISGIGGGREITDEDNWVAERWPQASGACGGIRSAVALDDIVVTARA